MTPNPLHEYEMWLDTLDAKLFVDGRVVRVAFDSPIEISLDDCKDLQGLKLQAARVRGVLARNESHLPKKYLIGRFVGLVLRHNKMKVGRDEVMRQLRSEWRIVDDHRDL